MEQVGEPACEAKAVQAEAVATTMSTPLGLRGEAAGRKRRGAASATLEAAGKVMAAVRGMVALRGEEELQGREEARVERVGRQARGEAAPV